mgnify:FL=1
MEKKAAGRPFGTTRGGVQRQIISISLQPEEKAALDAVLARYDIGQSDLFRFILNNAWLLSVPAVEIERLRKRAAGDD